MISKLDREIYFRNKKTSKCRSCKKEVTPETAIIGYNAVLCKECKKKVDKQAKKEIARAFGNLFSEEDIKDAIPRINKRLDKLENEVKKLKKNENKNF